MATGKRRPNAEAKADAAELLALCADCWDRWEIAGSIRRGKAEVGDVDHLCVARVVTEVGPGLFGEPVTVNLLWRRIDKLVDAGVVQKHWNGTCFKWGQVCRAVDYKGYCHEIHTCEAEAWGANLAIRTGGEETSRRLVTALRDGMWYRHVGGFKIQAVSSGEVVPTPDEATYFKLCGIPYLSPEFRG